MALIFRDDLREMPSEDPPRASARGVQIGLDSTMPSLRCPMKITLVGGDSAETLRVLLPRQTPKDTGR